MYKLIVIIILVLCCSQLGLSQRWISGNWEGKGYQTDADEFWSMKFQAHKGKFNIEYPSLNCSGEWKLIGFNDNKARFKENIRVNKENCEPTGNVIIQRLNSKQLLFIYSYIGKSQVTASAILNRTK